MQTKATSTSTVQNKGPIGSQITKQPEYHTETGEWLGWIWICGACADRDTRGADHIDHDDECPNWEAHR